MKGGGKVVEDEISELEFEVRDEGKGMPDIGKKGKEVRTEEEGEEEEEEGLKEGMR